MAAGAALRHAARVSGTGIRRFADDDAPEAAALVRTLWPHLMLTAERLLHDLRSTPARAHEVAWVAVSEKEIVGYADGRLHWRADDPTVAMLWVGVREDARREGVGTELHERLSTHLVAHGARTLRSSVADDSGRGFAAHHGYHETRREHFSTLDPREADLSDLPELERKHALEGYHVVTLGTLLDRPHDLHALYAEAEDDIPSDDRRGELAFDEWERETLRNPMLDPDASTTVVHRDRPVSFAWLLVDRDGGFAEHELTGTLRRHRGLGLARLAKLAALRWCAVNGIHTVLTANDAENTPMLRINGRLGYRPTIVSSEIARVI